MSSGDATDNSGSGWEVNDKDCRSCEDRRQKTEKMRLSCMVPSQVTNPADFTDATVSSVSFGG